jgi:hypothetical protein
MFPDDDQPSPLAKTFLTLGQAPTEIGCIAPVILVAAILVGIWLDRWMGVPRWLWVVLIVGGAFAGLAAMLRSAFLASQKAYRQYQAGKEMHSEERPAAQPREEEW